MKSREEIAAQVAEKLGIAPPLGMIPVTPKWIGKLWDALIDAEVKLAEREQPLGKSAIETYARSVGVESEERVKDLREALRMLIPVAEAGGNMGQVCNGCRRNSYEFDQHSDNCPVRRARAVLSEE
jgi:hypothetical protein